MGRVTVSRDYFISRDRNLTQEGLNGLDHRAGNPGAVPAHFGHDRTQGPGARMCVGVPARLLPGGGGLPSRGSEGSPRCPRFPRGALPQRKHPDFSGDS